MNLPAKAMRAVELFLSGKSLEETAKILRIRVATVTVYLFRARQILGYDKVPFKRNVKTYEHGLSKREYEVFGLIKKEGLNQGQLAKRLNITPSAVGCTFRRIYAKTGVRSRWQLIAQVPYNGWKIERPKPVPKPQPVFDDTLPIGAFPVSRGAQ